MVRSFLNSDWRYARPLSYSTNGNSKVSGALIGEMIVLFFIGIAFEIVYGTFIFNLNHALAIREEIIVLGYIDLIHGELEIDLEDLFNDAAFLEAIGKNDILPGVSIFVVPLFTKCQRHYVDSAVIKFMTAYAGFRNLSKSEESHAYIVMNNCDLSCSTTLFLKVIEIPTFISLCVTVGVNEKVAFITSSKEGISAKNEKVVMMKTSNIYKPDILDMAEMVRSTLKYLRLNCLNVVTVPETHYGRMIFRNIFDCHVSETFDVRNEIYLSAIDKNDSFSRRPKVYLLLMSEHDALEYHEAVMNENFADKKIPIILTNRIDPNDSSTFQRFYKLKRALFFDQKDGNPLLARSKFNTNSTDSVPIYFYDRVIHSLKQVMASARQILRNTREEVPGLINEFSITDGHSDLWLMWRDADSTRWINFGKYYFANKTTIKKIPEAGLWDLFPETMKDWDAVDLCGMDGHDCKDYTYGFNQKYLLMIRAVALIGLIIFGYFVYLAVRFKVLQKSVVQWKISYYDDVKRSHDLRKQTSAIAAVVRKKSSMSTPQTQGSIHQALIASKAMLNANKSNSPGPGSSGHFGRVEIQPKKGNGNLNKSAGRDISMTPSRRFKRGKFRRLRKTLKDIMFRQTSPMDSSFDVPRKSSLFEKSQSVNNLAFFQEEEVFLSRMHHGKLWENMFNTKILEELEQMKNLNHENLLPFLGVSMKYGTILMLAARRGSLRDIIKDRCLNQVFNLGIMVSILIDIAKGMDYLHDSDIGSHGSLRSSKCVLDNRWNCKITGYGLKSIREYKLRKKKKATIHNFLYYAPELLRTPINYRSIYGTRKGDIYAFGIILQEAILMDQPYSLEIKNKNMDIVNILVHVRSRKEQKPFRPSLGENCREEWKMLAEACWHEIPENRFNFMQIVTILRKLAGTENLTFVERLSQRLEQNVSNLGNMVSDLTADVQKESEKTNAFLSCLLPKIVAQDYILGKSYKPEIFQNVTILCTDIIGFTKLSSMSTPRQTVEFLRNLYSRYDAIVTKRDAYKLETIGDAYIVISGCPERNGNFHASEVAQIALSIVSLMSSLKIPHLPREVVQIRAGVHSGPVIAGVVGLKVPRFCIFGKTYNVAEMLEGASEANKILISKVSVDLLPRNHFLLEHRGKLDLPDKETLETYFLVKKL